MKQRAGKSIAVLLTAMAAISFAQSAGAASQVVWQIGKFDKSSQEFNQSNVPTPKDFGARPEKLLVYTIGKSQEKTDWFRFQPGSSNGLAGFRPHPYTIKFDVPSIPRGLYTLKVALIVERPLVSRLEININGHHALYYQHPVLDYASGDFAGIFLPYYSTYTVSAEFPADFLRRGTNELALTANDDSRVRDDSTDSGIFYDAIQLAQDANAKYPANTLAINATPTIFYVQKDHGPAELVDVYIRHSSPCQDGRVNFTLGNTKLTAKLDPQWEIGEEMVEFAVPEFNSGAKGEVAIHAGGRTLRFPVVLDPAKKWNFFVVPHTHLDVGYTDYQAKVAETQSRSLDEAIQMVHDNPDFRFSVDGYWCVRQFLAERTEEQKQLLYQAVKEKKIFVPTVEASLLTGFPSLETLLRSLYPAFDFNQKHSGDADYVDITDVPSYSWSYASIMAAAGMKYFAAGSDNYRAPILLNGRLQERSPFWWEGPDGGRILMWYSRHYHQVKTVFGLPAQVAAGRQSLPLFLLNYSQPEYKSDAAIIYGTQVENTDLVPQQATFVDEWNKIYAYPRLQYSGFAEAIKYIAGQMGDSVPVVRGDGGPYWEDGIATTARSAAIERETEQRALGAEKFSTLSSLLNPRLRPDADSIKQLWNDMVLYDEHTWGDYRSVTNPKSDEAVRQLALKEDFANRAKNRVNDLLWRSLAALADQISDPQDTLLVFNPLSWQRSGLMEFDLDKGLDLIDLTTQQRVSYEILSTGPDYHRIRFMAQDVPSVGYKAYAIKPAAQAPPTPARTVPGTVENRYYRVVLDPVSGAVNSIFDKELNKELVNTSSPYRFDQYLYVTGADKAPNRAVRYSSVLPVPEFTTHGASGGRLVSVTQQPFGVVARLESQGMNTPKVETEIVLSNSEKKIEFINHVHKTEVFTRESVYFVFPFSMAHPQFRYEIQNGVVDPRRDQMPGAGKEWFSVQHWVAADENGVSVALVPVDAPLVCLGDIFRATWPTEFGSRPGTIFSYTMMNYWDTNYAAGQGGDFTFRYVLTSGNHLEGSSLSRLGWDEMTPLESERITAQDKALDTPRPLAGAQGSFVQVDQPNVVLVTWKEAEDGNGTVFRFVETGGQAGTVAVQIPHLDVKAAWSSDAMERKQSSLATSARGFSFAVKPYQIVTVRVEGAGNIK